MATNLREDSGIVSLGQSTEHPLFVQLIHGQFPLSSREHLILSLAMGQPRSIGILVHKQHLLHSAHELDVGPRRPLKPGPIASALIEKSWGGSKCG